MTVHEHTGNEKSYLWHAPNFSDEELKDELYCIRFAFVEIEFFVLLFWLSITLQGQLEGEDQGDGQLGVETEGLAFGPFGNTLPIYFGVKVRTSWSPQPRLGRDYTGMWLRCCYCGVVVVVVVVIVVWLLLLLLYCVTLGAAVVPLGSIGRTLLMCQGRGAPILAPRFYCSGTILGHNEDFTFLAEFIATLPSLTMCTRYTNIWT